MAVAICRPYNWVFALLGGNLVRSALENSQHILVSSVVRRRYGLMPVDR